MKLLFCLLPVSCYLQALDKSSPPAYAPLVEESVASSSRPVRPVLDIPHRFFLEPIEQKNTTLMLKRAYAYFSGNDGVVMEPIMGYAQLEIACNFGSGDAYFALAERLDKDSLINQEICRETIRKAYCRAIQKGHINALAALRRFTGDYDLKKEDIIKKFPESDMANQAFLEIITAPQDAYNAQEICQAGVDFIVNDTLKPDYLRALSLFCLAYHKYPESPAGAEELVNFLQGRHYQSIFKPLPLITAHYIKQAKKRGSLVECEPSQVAPQHEEPSGVSFSQILSLFRCCR